MDQYLSALKITPLFRDYVWGGGRLRPGERTAEAWVVYEGAVIAEGALSGKTLGEAAAVYGADLLGSRAVEHTGLRFPLLIKLLDCADWLSLQVHPNDEQAVQLEGADHFGKTEAWHFIDADAGAQIICGLKPGMDRDRVRRAIQDGTILDHVQYLPVSAGNSVLIQSGTIHALGPGMLLYEVQQTSDITYRVFDWNRPASAGRKLHIEQSMAVVNPAQQVEMVSALAGEGDREVVRSGYFALRVGSGCLEWDTQGASFHVVTATAGGLRVNGRGWAAELPYLSSLVVPACCGAYQVETAPGGRALCAAVDG